MSRFAFVSAAILTEVLGLGASALPASAAMFEPPPRRPGLWTMTTNFSGRSMSTQMCLDAATDKKFTIMGQSMGRSCSATDMSRAPDGIHFHTVCSGPSGGTITTNGVIKGDFSSRYSMDAVSTTVGSSMTMLNKTSHMQIAASWTGPCAAGQRPGDMILSNGMKVNMLSGMH